MSITMKEVAKYANLSLGTVSNYVNGKKSVSKENCEKIQDAIRILGYKVNEVARSLKTKSFNTIGVLLPTFGNVYLIKIISYIEEILRNENYSMLVVSSRGDIEKEQELMTYLSNRVDGIIYAPSMFDRIDTKFFHEIQLKTPVVTINEKLENVICDSVIVDLRELVKNAIGDLIGKGYDKIGLIAGPKGVYTTRERLCGYQEAHDKYGLKFDENLVRFSNYSRGTAKSICTEMLEENEEISAFFVAGYRMTLGVLSCLESRGLSDKIKVIGFDAEDIEEIVSPKLTYVNQPCQTMAEVVVKLMIKRVNEDYEGFPAAIALEGTIKNLGSIPQK